MLVLLFLDSQWTFRIWEDAKKKQDRNQPMSKETKLKPSRKNERVGVRRGGLRGSCRKRRGRRKSAIGEKGKEGPVLLTFLSQKYYVKKQAMLSQTLEEANRIFKGKTDGPERDLDERMRG